jgi:LuxR family maltose regulon positive regulatory protein
MTAMISDRRDPQAMTVALTPLLDGFVPRTWVVAAFLLGAIARDSLGDPDAPSGDLERALDLAGTDHALFAFLIHPAPGLLKRHDQHRAASAALVSEVVELLAHMSRSVPSPGESARACKLITQGEIRVLPYLVTNLSAPEIAEELYLSTNTVRTHVRHLYQKLGAHIRIQAIERARAPGLLAPRARA